jgi:hypothetical protein
MEGCGWVCEDSVQGVGAGEVVEGLEECGC